MATARAGYNTAIPASPTVTTIFDSSAEGKNVEEIAVGCNPDAAFGLLVNVENMHGIGSAAVYVKIYPGGEKTFKRKSGISKVTVKGDGGASIADWAVTGEQ